MGEQAWTAAALSDAGRCRTENQDALVFDPKIALFAVSDGMGGLPYGRQTAQMVSAMMKTFITSLKIQEQTLEQFMGHLRDGIRKISDEIQEMGNLPGQPASYGATLSGFVVFQDHVVVFNVGDSRVYRMRQNSGQLEKLTKDHSVVQLLLDDGEITPEEAKTHEARSIITRFMGMYPTVRPDITAVPILTGDRFLVCSDGLHGMVSESGLGYILGQEDTPQRICQQLVQSANDSGGVDNISVAVWIANTEDMEVSENH